MFSSYFQFESHFYMIKKIKIFFDYHCFYRIIILKCDQYIVFRIIADQLTPATKFYFSSINKWIRLISFQVFGSSYFISCEKEHSSTLHVFYWLFPPVYLSFFVAQVPSDSSLLFANLISYFLFIVLCQTASIFDESPHSLSGLIFFLRIYSYWIFTIWFCIVIPL